MKKFYIISLCLFLLLNFSDAKDPQELKESHQKILQAHGDSMENTSHYYLFHAALGTTTEPEKLSVFVSGNRASYYYENNHSKIQIIGENTPNELTVTNRLKINERVLTCKYSLTYKSENGNSLAVKLDETESTIRIDTQKLFLCVISHWEDIETCLKYSNLTECLLKLAIPLYKIHQCIFESQMILSQRVTSKTYSVNFGSGNNQPRYFQLENLPVAFVEKKITSKSNNVTFVAIDHAINNQVLKVICSVWYSGLSWSVTGTITIIYGN